MLIAREAYSGREVTLPDATAEALLEALNYIPDAPVSVMYHDKTDGRTVQVGWCIDNVDNDNEDEEYTEWWTLYTIEPFEQEA